MTAELALYLLGATVAGFVSGLIGFGFALVAAPLWLRILEPIDVTTLVVAYGVVTQGYTIWTMRRDLRLGPSVPLIVGGLLGVPLGVSIVSAIDPHAFRIAIGIFMMAYTAWLLARPRVGRLRGGGRIADGGAGFASGVLGGMAGFSGPIAALWCTLRPWSKDEQRQALQPYLLVMHVSTLLSLAVAGSLDRKLGTNLLLGLPLVVVSLWLGFRIYRRMRDESFRRIVLWVLFASGFSLLW
ncbi:MAG: sulfite exporter TauE/SafE family protein [Alphaproteobacteria bacterium]